MSREENMKNMKRMAEEVMNAGKLELVDELVSPDYILHESTGEEFKGPEGFKQFATRMHNAFPDMHATIEDMIADENKVAIRVTFRGTHKGSMMGIQPTGKQVNTPTMIVSHFKNGKQVETWQSYDMLGTLQQMGVAPPMAQAVK